ncbi:hypothetical protein D3C72_957300 [compost metagenome]
MGGVGGAVDGVAFGIEVDVALLEGLEHGGDLQEIGHADLVVIVEANLARNVLAPIIRIALPDDSFARPQGLDSVWTRADDCAEAGLFEFFRIDRMFWQDRGGGGENERRFAVGLVVEGETHAAITDLFQLRHPVQTAVEGRAAFFLQKIEGEDHVICGHRLAVGPFCLRVDVELDEASLLIPLHCFGQQAVKAERLIAGAQHQGFVEKIAEFRVPDAARRGAHSLENEGIEAVEGADDAIGDAAAFLHVRIDIRKVPEVCGELRRAVHGNAVQRLRQGVPGGKQG